MVEMRNSIIFYDKWNVTECDPQNLEEIGFLATEIFI